MKKIITRLLLVPYIFSTLVSAPLNAQAASFDITLHANDTSTDGTTWTAGATSMKPGDFIRLSSKAKNNTASTGSTVQMNFSNTALDSNYSAVGVTASTPSRFYITPSPGFASGNTGVGFNPPTQNFGTFPQDLPPASTAFVYQYAIKIGLGYNSPIFVPEVSFSAVGLPNSGTSNLTINVDVKPHVRSVTFSNGSIPNDNSATTNLTVTVRDWNGCTNLTPGTASVTANLSSLGNGYTTTESLSFVSCNIPSNTATFQKTGIMANGSAVTGANSITVAVKDNNNNIGGPSDGIFWNVGGNVGDTNTQTITVNSSTGPIPSVDNQPSPAILGTSGSASIGWHSNKLGTYEVRVGGNKCTDGTLVSSGAINSTAANSIVSIIPASSLSNGGNTVYLCATDLVSNVGLVTASITKDTIPPTSNISTTFATIVTSQNVTVTWDASEAGTYAVDINGSSLNGGDGTNTVGSYSVGNIVSTINNSIFLNGSNTIRIKFTDTVGNGPVYSNSVTVTKDFTAPSAPLSVALTDCDALGNTGTPCAILGNPKNGVSGRDFYINFVLPTATGSIQEYDIYATLSGQVLTSTSSILKRVYQNDITGTSTGIWLDDSTVADSNGNAFITNGTGTYYATIKSFKSNGLYSSGTDSSGSIVSFDSISLPVFSGASFTFNTGITLTYSKSLTGNISLFNATKISSASGCFTMDTSTGTGARSVSGSSVTFAVQPLGNIARTCTDLIIGTGAVTDFEGLFNEESLTGKTVSDGQIPLPISITAPSNNRFIGGNGSFVFSYIFPEAMNTGSIVARFISASGATINYPVPAFSLSGSHSLSLTGSVIGLIDGQTYSLRLMANDIAGNAGISSPVSGIVYDITAPTVPTLLIPSLGSFISIASPMLTWAGSTDNYSSAPNLRYTMELSLVLDFSSILGTNTSIAGTGFTLTAPLVTNTGYYWRVKATDEAGNTGSFSLVHSFTFDNTTPVVNTLGSNTYIDNTTRSFTGYVKNTDTAVLHAKITDNFQSTMLASDITANLSSLGGGSGVSPSSYNTGTNLAVWNSIIVSCADGVKNIPITATDRAGNIGTYTMTAVCDNTAPAITAGTFTSPSSGAYLSGGITTNITWNTGFYASEASPVANPISLDYSTNSGGSWTPLLSNSANNGSVSWSVPGLDTSNALARITATDKLGNVATGTISFIIDSTNPSVSLSAVLSPNGGEFLKGSTGAGISITWNAGAVTDTNFQANPVSLDYSTDSGSTWSGIATALPNNGSYLWTPSAPAYNSSNIRIRLVATDRVGHTATDSSDANFTIDSTSPTIAINSPSTPPNASFINNSGFDISSVGTDTNIDKVYYSFSSAGTYWNASGSGSWLGVANWNVLCTTPAGCNAINTPVAPGPIIDGTVYTLILRSIDKAGNSIDSASSLFTGDTVLPSITNLVQSGAYFSGSVAIAGTGSDIRSGIASLTLQIQRTSDNWSYDGTAFINTGAISLLATTSNSYANWSYTGFIMPVGDADGTEYTIKTTAIDRAYKINNTSFKTITLIKDSGGPTITAPVWTSPAGGEIWNGGTTKTITWNPARITDSVSGVNAVNGIVIEYSTGGSFAPVANGIANSGSYNWTLPYPLDSSITLRIRARDYAGNLGAGSVSNSFTIDSIPPTITTVETIGDTLGKISGMAVHFSENINTASLTTNQFSWSLGSPFVAGYTIVSPQIVELRFASATGTTALMGTLSYSGNSVYDIAGNTLASVTKSIVDKASPVITSTVLLDTDGNGKVDQVRAYWSEPLTSTIDTSAWIVNNPFPGVGANPTGVSVSGNVATLTISEPTTANTSSGGMTVSFTANASWKDLSASLNAASSLSNSILVDQATPLVVGMQTVDNSGNYAIDMIFSEPITGTVSGFTLSGSSTYSGTILPINTTTLRFITTDLTSINTAKTYSLSYNGSGISLKDTSNNYLANFADISVTDAIAPKILTRTTMDSNGNGKIDAIRYGFSEPLSGTSSGTMVSVAGYVVTGYASIGTGLTVHVTEALAPDTSATPLVQFQNTTLSDASGNLIPSEGSTTAATDAVGPVVTGVRFDGSSTLFATFSESISGALAPSSFILSGATATISSISAPTGSNSGIITLSGNGIIAGTSEFSFSGNSVGDIMGNKQSGTSFTKVSASVIINEVMWSATGSSATEYIELRNLGTIPVDISGWKIDNAMMNGTATLTIPASQTIPANGYYMITATPPSNASNLLSTGVTAHFVGSLSLAQNQIGSLILKTNAGTVYDQAKANPWSAGDANLPASMERKTYVGDGLQPSSWYIAQIGSGFDIVGPLGTPGTANVFDAIPPTIGSFTPADNTLYPMGNITMVYNYSDSGGMATVPNHIFLLEKNNGVGGYADVTPTSLSSSGISATMGSFVTNLLAYGQYRATFTISDSAGNNTQQISSFYVDAPSMSISTGSYAIGTLSPGSTTLGTGGMTVTIQTLGAGFRLSLGGSGTLDAGVSQIGGWNGTAGYGMDYATSGSGTFKSYNGGLTSISGATLENFSTGSHIGGNGTLRTYIYTVKYGAKISALQVAGMYISNTPVHLSLQY